jgi:hypothetical protein
MYSRTSLVENNYENLKLKLLGIDPVVYRWRNCDTNLNSNTPANRYQILKLIQKTVRVPSSLYTMNLAGLNAYQRPNETYNVVDVAGTNYLVSPGVNWNQMSDRREPHIQKVVTSSGSAYRGSSTKRTIVSSRPGAMSPGGAGVDIKHNSYDRYLNRIKGKGPLKRGVVPPYFSAPFIPFNPAAPIYGGKIMKTSIVNGCNCNEFINDNEIIYKNPLYQDIDAVQYKFGIGQIVFAKEGLSEQYKKATITSIFGSIYIVRFEDGITEDKNISQIKIYDKSCDCIPFIDEPLLFPLPSGGVGCVFPNNAFLKSLAQ